MVAFITLIAAALSSFQINVVVAAPQLMPRSTLCSLSAASHLDFLPADIPQPSKTPGFLGIGVGFQNYTCEDGKYSPRGAVAQLFDTSCLYGKPEFKGIPDQFISEWEKSPGAERTPEQALGHVGAGTTYPLLSDHYFIPNVDGTRSPKWDGTNTGPIKGAKDAYVVVKAGKSVPAPTGTQDINWLYLTSIDGKLAEEVYRTDTRHGQPPAQCNPSDNNTKDISVKYVSYYFFFGGGLLPRH